MQHAAFSAFFVIQDKLHRDPRLAGPVRKSRCASIADQVTGVGTGVVHRYEDQVSSADRTARRQAGLKAVSRPLYFLGSGRAYSPCFAVTSPSVTSASTSFTAAVTPSTTGTPRSPLIAAPRSAMPAQPR